MGDDQQTPEDNDLTPDKVLMAWITAVTKFHACYYQVAAFINQSSVGQHTSRQALLSQLWETRATMEAGLARLWVDFTQIGEGEELPDFERIKAHTTQLNQLIQHAQRVLHLASLSNS